MRHLLTAPVLTSHEDTQRARIFHRVVWTMMATISVFLLALAAIQPDVSLRGFFAIGFINLLGLSLLLVSRAGRTTSASWLLIAGLIGLVTGMSFQSGGVRSPGVSYYLLFVLMAGVLLGMRAGVITGLACASLSFGLVIIEKRGYLPEQSVFYSPETRWLITCMYIGVVLILLDLATGAMKDALARARTELAERREAERARELMLNQLTERVKELRLLHAASRLTQGDRRFDRQLCKDIVALMPHAWQHADCCEARITFGDIDERTPGWRETPWHQTAVFATSAGAGSVGVVYTELRAPVGEDPFLDEERELITSIAEIVSATIERDHTERRRRTLEQQLRQSQKMEALGTMAGGVAHDFNNILTAIGGNAAMALDDLPPDHPARESVAEIQHAHARAADLVRRILTFSRKQDTHKAPVDLTAVVDEAVRLLRVSLTRSISVHAEYERGLPPVLADSTQVHQIVMNLGTNAAHAMKISGGTLRVTLSSVAFANPDEVPAVELRPGRYLRLDIADTGSGIPPESVERLFEPFFTTKGEAGTGLGLSVVHGIVHEHGGAITVQSAVGEGTTFSVYLPVTSPA
jgi:signal transduction histidine kinase